MSPDTIVPTSTQGTQAWDRYAFVNNNPVRYTDPTGHVADEDEGYSSYHCSDGTTVQYPSQCPQPPPSESDDEWNYDEIKDSVCQPLVSLSPCTLSDALVWGFSFSGSMPGLHSVAGMDELLFFDDLSRAVYSSAGEGGEVPGGGGSGTAYIGEVYNIENPEDWLGPFGEVGATFATPVGGFSISYFWDTAQDPFTPGSVKGYKIGYSVGAEASIWWSTTTAQLVETY